ncbi:hypothetical protein HQ520_13440 [bacterium]|nr:hypothetical protein [bacterium]
MAHENFRIRIGRDGRIYFLTRDLGEGRMIELREMLEDALGPVQEVRVVEGGDLPPPGVALVEEEKTEELKKRH